MTLLLDAEARLFAVPEEPAAPTARRRAPRPPRGRQSAPAPLPLRPRSAEPAPTAPAEPASPERGGGGTLDDLLTETWDGLATASVPVACPVCDGELVRRWSAGAGVVGGRCRDCGTELS